jgi:predicted signal transduction protein with EAL and GGDEF domain
LDWQTGFLAFRVYSRALARARRSARSSEILIEPLRLHAVNEALGHKEGDRVLVEVRSGCVLPPTARRRAASAETNLPSAART